MITGTIPRHRAENPVHPRRIHFDDNARKAEALFDALTAALDRRAFARAQTIAADIQRLGFRVEVVPGTHGVRLVTQRSTLTMESHSWSV